MANYWCSRCGKAVQPDAESCPLCKAIFGGVREGAEFDRMRASTGYVFEIFQSITDTVLCFIDEHWILLLLFTYSPLLLGCHWLWNNDWRVIVIFAVIAIAAFSGLILWYKGYHKFISDIFGPPVGHTWQPTVIKKENPRPEVPPLDPSLLAELKAFVRDNPGQPLSHDILKKFPPIPITEVGPRISMQKKEIYVSPSRSDIRRYWIQTILFGSDTTDRTINYVSWRLFLFGGLFGLILLPFYALGLVGGYWIGVFVAKTL